MEAVANMRVARVLLAALFVVSGFNMLMGMGFSGVVAMIGGMTMAGPVAYIGAVLVLATKIVGGLTFAFGRGKWVEYAGWALVVFTVLTIIFGHSDMPKDLTAALKNIAIIGGFLAVLSARSRE
jgi:uncharacterized membrane protein YphA (DoxX/SURF4 family)